MMSWLKRPRWSPYLVGALIGVLSWITFAAMGKALGTSTTMVRVAGAIESAVAPEHVESNAYFTKYLGTAEKPKPAVEWQFALVVFMVVGSFLAATLGGTLRRETVPAIWAQRFGNSRLKRFLGAFVGGVILLFGARLAGGCTSGHGLSGGLQLAVGSWIFIAAMFATGIVTAAVMFGRKG
jgi:uncharacterized membrane protein YedE/YeeE